MAAPLHTSESIPSPRGWPLDRLEVRFESDEAFERGLALARKGAGVTVCHADGAARRLVLRLSSGTGPARPRLLH